MPHMTSQSVSQSGSQEADDFDFDFDFHLDCDYEQICPANAQPMANAIGHGNDSETAR